MYSTRILCSFVTFLWCDCLLSPSPLIYSSLASNHEFGRLKRQKSAPWVGWKLHLKLLTFPADSFWNKDLVKGIFSYKHFLAIYIMLHVHGKQSAFTTTDDPQHNPVWLVKLYHCSCFQTVSLLLLLQEKWLFGWGLTSVFEERFSGNFSELGNIYRLAFPPKSWRELLTLA